MRPNGPRRRAAAELAQLLAPFFLERGFERHSVCFHRLCDSVWQSVSLITHKGWINVQLDAASLSVRRALGRYAEFLVGSSADERTPPKGGDVLPFSVGGWDWGSDHDSVLTEIQDRLSVAIPEFFGPRSSEAQLLSFVGPGLVSAILYALRGDRRAVDIQCANLRHGCIQRSGPETVFPLGSLETLRSTQIRSALDAAHNWRLQVQLVYEVLERTNPLYKTDPRVLTDEYYEAAASAAAVTVNGLSPSETTVLIRDTLETFDSPEITMIIDGITNSREDLEAMLRTYIG